MEINFKNLEDYLLAYGYPKNELMNSEKIIIPEKTSYEYTMENANKFYNKTAMTFYGNKIRYEKFASKIDKTADAMKGLGLKCDERVATLLPNIPEAAYMQYGPSKIGASVSNIDPRVNAETLLKFIKKENIKQVVILEQMYENAIRPIERELKEIYGIERIVIVPATESLPYVLKKSKNFLDKKKGVERIKSDVVEVVYWDELLENSIMSHATNIGYRPNKEAVVQHSSGTTTGAPKSIPLTNENINSFVEGHKPTEFGELKPGTKLLHVLPYFAAYGSINSAHLGFNFGFNLQEIPEFNFADFGKIAYKTKSEIIIGVPNWFNAASKDATLVKKNMPFIKMAISGGTKNSPEGKKCDDLFFEKVGAKCIETNGHGMSELCGSGSYQFKGHHNGLGIGIPFPYVKYIIVDKEGNIVPMKEDGIQGTAYIYSPAATSGYFDGEQFAETIDINGFKFLNSKDTIHIDPNYEMHFVDREDRQFARFDGHKIVPSDVESRICGLEEVNDCIVVPYDDEENLGKMPAAYVKLNNELDDTVKGELVEKIANLFLNSNDATNREFPKKIKFVNKFPQNAMSKNDYKELEKREMDGSEYTINVIETNLKIEGYSIIKPIKPKVLIKK